MACQNDERHSNENTADSLGTTDFLTTECMNEKVTVIQEAINENLLGFLRTSLQNMADHIQERMVLKIQSSTASLIR